MRKFSIVLKYLCTSALFALSGSILAQNTAGLDTATGQSNDEVTETIGALAPAMTVDEIAQELINPVTSLSSVATDIQYRTFQGSLPGADDKTSWIYLFTPSFPIPLSNGKNILLRATIPLYADQPIWGLPIDHPLWVVDKDYAEFRIGRVPLKFAFEVHHYVVSADRFAPKWLLTFSITPGFGNP